MPLSSLVVVVTASLALLSTSTASPVLNNALDRRQLAVPEDYCLVAKAKPGKTQCALQGTLGKQRLNGQGIAADAHECAQRCYTLPPKKQGRKLPCQAFSFDSASSNCKLYFQSLAKMNFTPSNPPAGSPLYYARECYVRKTLSDPFADGNFNKGEADDEYWTTYTKDLTGPAGDYSFAYITDSGSTSASSEHNALVFATHPQQLAEGALAYLEQTFQVCAGAENVYGLSFLRFVPQGTYSGFSITINGNEIFTDQPGSPTVVTGYSQAFTPAHLLYFTARKATVTLRFLVEKDAVTKGFQPTQDNLAKIAVQPVYRSTVPEGETVHVV